MNTTTNDTIDTAPHGFVWAGNKSHPHDLTRAAQHTAGTPTTTPFLAYFHNGRAPHLNALNLEFTHQLARQQRALNQLTAYEFLSARHLYRAHGRGPDGPQRDARKQHREELHEVWTELDPGLTDRQIEQRLDRHFAALAVLHEPDSILGGRIDPHHPQLGNSNVNSSIGGQNSGLGNALERAIRQLPPEQQHNQLNVVLYLHDRAPHNSSDRNTIVATPGRVPLLPAIDHPGIRPPPGELDYATRQLLNLHPQAPTANNPWADFLQHRDHYAGNNIPKDILPPPQPVQQTQHTTGPQITDAPATVRQAANPASPSGFFGEQGPAQQPQQHHPSIEQQHQTQQQSGPRIGRGLSH